MDVSDATSPAMNPWHPMTNPVDLKHIGKLGEEAGELASAAARCSIQGIDEREPVTGKLNRTWLEDEIADVMANSDLCMEHFGLDRLRILERAARKMVLLREWHSMADEPPRRNWIERCLDATFRWWRGY